MKHAYCYTIQGVDTVMAKIMESALGGRSAVYTPALFASLRGLLDESLGIQPENAEDFDTKYGIKIDKRTGKLSISNENKSKVINELLKPLLTINNKKMAEKLNKLHTIVDNQASLWDIVSENYDNFSTFLERVSQMSYYISKAIDTFLENYNRTAQIKLRRQDVLNGVKTEDGRVIKDFNSIILDVYNTFVSDYNKMINGQITWESEEVADRMTRPYIEEEFSKMFKPEVWSAMVLVAKTTLKDIEGLNVNLYNNTAEEAIMRYTSENAIADIFSPDESTKEGWQIITDMLSAYGSLTKEVRAALGKVFITYVDSQGEIHNAVDSLGYKKRMDPLSAYNLIRETIRNCGSKEQMMSYIAKEKALGDLYQHLSGNYYLQTQVWNNFNKIFQLYSQLDDKKSLMITLNKSNTDTAFSRLLNTFKISTDPLFARNRVAWNEEDLNKLINAFKKFNPESNGEEKSLWELYGSEENSKIIKALEEISNYLGLSSIFPTSDGVNSFVKASMSSMKTFKKVCGIIWGLYEHGGVGNLKKGVGGYNDWIFRNEIGKEHTEAYNKIKQLVDITVKKTYDSQFQSKARSIDAKGNPVTLFADVQSNYMGDLIKKLKQYTDLRDVNISEYDKQRADDLKYIKNSRRAAAAEYLINKFFKGTSFCNSFKSELKFQVGKNKWITIKNVPVSSEISCAWFRYLWDDIVTGDMFEEDSFTQNFLFQRVVSGKFNGNLSAFENFTAAQHFKTIVDSYFYYDTQHNGIMSDFIHVPVFILGDSGVFKLLKIKRFTSFDDYQNINGENIFNEEKIVNELYKIYKSELRRMKLFQAMVAQEGWTADTEGINPNVFNNQNRFTMLTFLNDSFKNNSFEELCEKDEADVKKEIEEYLKKGFNKFLKLGRDSGVLNANNESTRQLLQSSALNIKKESGGNVIRVSLEERLKELYYNIYLSNLNQFQMFTGDLGFYKDVKEFQKRYKEIHAPGDTLDTSVVSDFDQLALYENGKPMPTFDKYQKVLWLKDMEANMEQLDSNFMKVLLRTFKVASEEEVEEAIKNGIITPNKTDTEEGRAAEEKRIESLKKLLGNNYRIYDAYVHDTTRTDGQCYRSIDSYRKVQIMRGLWNEFTEAAYQRYKKIEKDVISQNRDITEDELKEILAYSTYFQPLKPFTFTMEEYKIDTKVNGERIKDTLMIPVQIKCAECILMPAFFKKGSRLRELGEAMQSKENPIDLVGFDSTVKVGCFSAIDLEASDERGNVSIKNNIANAISNGKLHQYDLGDTKIQTNVPAHINVERAIGTQIRKLILNNINFAKEFYKYIRDFSIPDKETFVSSYTYTDGRKRGLNGAGLVNFYNGLNMVNMLQSFRKFEHFINNPDQLGRVLSQSLISNHSDSFRKLMELAVSDGKFAVPLYEGASAHDNQAMIYSLYRKMVNKQDIKGGSMVQVSDYGVTVVQEVGKTEKDRPLHFITDKSGKNIIKAEIEVPFDFSYVDAFGKEQSLKYSEYCNADGTFKKNADGRYKIDVDFPGMRDLIAYRIPSEREYSMINCEIVRCVPPLSGGIIRVPAQGLTIAGFDFDIDKLYILRRDFRKKLASIESPYINKPGLLNSIFKQVYKNDIARRSNKAADLYREIEGLRESLKRIRKSDKSRKSEDMKKRIEDMKNYLKDLVSEYNKLKDEKGAIINILREIRSNENGNKFLNQYWDKMIEENPWMEEDPNYNKNALFKEAAEQLGVWVEVESGKQENIYYDFNVAIDKNPRFARNNVIFDIIRGRLMDPETLEARLTPGGFYDSKKVAKEFQVLNNDPDLVNHLSEDGSLDVAYFESVVEKAKNKASYDDTMDAADVSTLIYYNQLNQVAGKLIGVFANQNNNQQFTSLLETLSLKSPIIFGQMMGATIVERNSNAADNPLGQTLLAKKVKLRTGKIIDTDITLAEFLAAAVDAVKTPVLNYLYFNSTTAAAGALLARMGHDLRDIGLIFNQPIMKSICNTIANNNGLYDFDTAKNEIFNIIAKKSGKRLSDIREEYKKIGIGISTGLLMGAEAKWVAMDNIDKLNAEKGEITDNKSRLYTDQSFVNVQLSALKIFEKARNASQELNSLIKATKFTAANAVGSTAGFFFNLEEEVSQFINNEKGELIVHIANRLREQGSFRVLDPNVEDDVIAHTYKYLNKMADNSLAIEQCMYDLNKKLMRVIGKYFPYLTNYYESRRNALKNFLLKPTNILSADEIDSLHRDIMLQYLATPIVGEDNYFNPNEECKEWNPDYDPTTEDNYTNRDYFLYKFPSTLDSVKNIIANILKYYNEGQISSSSVIKLPLLDMIYPTYKETKQKQTGRTYKRLGIGVTRYNTVEKIRLIDAWGNVMRLAPKFDSFLKEALDRIDNDIQKYERVISNPSAYNPTEVVSSHTELNKLARIKDDLEKVINKGRNLFLDLGIGLFMHNYYQSGFNKTPYSYMEDVPIEVKRYLKVGNTSYLDFIELNNIDKRASVNDKDGMEKFSTEMAYMYVLNHPDNYRLTKTFNPDNNYTFSGKRNPFVSNSRTQESFTVDLNDETDYSPLFVKSTENSPDGEITVYNLFPVVRYGDNSYICTINGSYATKTTNSGANVEYIRVPTLGYNNLYSFYARSLREALDTMKMTRVENKGRAEWISHDEMMMRRVVEENGSEDFGANQSNDDLEVNDVTTNQDTVSEEENTMPDVEEIRERMEKCTQMDRAQFARVMMVAGLGSKAMDVLSMSEAEGRVHAINSIVDFLRQEIESGRKEVYTKVDNLIICK